MWLHLMRFPLLPSTKFLDSKYHVNEMMDKANASLHMRITMFLKHNSVYSFLYSHFKSLFFFLSHVENGWHQIIEAQYNRVTVLNGFHLNYLWVTVHCKWQDKIFTNKIWGHSHSTDFERYTGIQLSLIRS